VYIGVAAGLIFTTWGTLTSGKQPAWDLGPFNFKLHPVMIGVLAHVVLLVAGYLGSFLFAAPPEASRAMTLWGWLQRQTPGARAIKKDPAEERTCRQVGVFKLSALRNVD
jgi:hypothetical protein